MDITVHRSAQILALALATTVVTQIFYVVLSNAGVDFSRMIVWTSEAVTFMAIAVCGLVLLARGVSHSVAWAAVALGGAFNLIQVGMGLAMFGPVKDAGEAMEPAYKAILAGAFFLYFAGKFLFGFAAILIGTSLFKGTDMAAKAVGGLAVLTGLAALITNLLGMAKGIDMVFIAGAAGTAATLFLAIATFMAAREAA